MQSNHRTRYGCGRRSAALLLMLSMACSGAHQSKARTQASGHRSLVMSHDVARYRLLLRDNPVDPGEAFRCHGHCQAESSPRGYLECLQQCPGFEITQNEYCSNTEVPPIAACLTVRRIPMTKEPDPNLVVLAVVGSFLLVVGAASLCNASKSQCGYGYYPY
ncbi:MAG TPA: hypothetical protein VIV60_19700 [Polyangiaceae bacterium]